MSGRPLRTWSPLSSWTDFCVGQTPLSPLHPRGSSRSAGWLVREPLSLTAALRSFARRFTGRVEFPAAGVYPGKPFAWFVNAQPEPGEPVNFSNSATTLMMQSDESDPDFALVTRIRLGNAGEVLIVFGDRSQTGVRRPPTHRPGILGELTRSASSITPKPHARAPKSFFVSITAVGALTGLA
jgi:hypothetical protein